MIICSSANTVCSNKNSLLMTPMTNEKILLMKAVQYNWSLHGAGEWTESKWRVFTNGTYELTVSFLPNFDDIPEKVKSGRSTKKKKTGVIDRKTFAQLREALEAEPWEKSAEDTFACDGVGWEIILYHEDGSILKTSGKPGYIYGNKTLEKIVAFLPYMGEQGEPE